MVISNKSWHWRYYVRIMRLFGESPRRNLSLCKYFWSIVGLTLATPFVALCVAIIMPIVWLCVKCIAEPWERRKARKNEDPWKPKEPNLLVEFIKARKNKVCPLIEVRDDD